MIDRHVPCKPALQGGVKRHNINGDYLTGKPFDMLRAESSVERPRPLGRGASLFVEQERVDENG
jgi:hypothetical protein